MKKKIPQWLTKGVAVGFLIALIISAIPTGMDWYANPAGIFRSENGTNWSIVFETLFSWFWPLFIVFVAASMAVLFWISSRAKKQAE